MKKNYYSLLAAATMLMAATSCSQEEDFAKSSNEMTTFKVQLENAVQSRAYGDGSTADQLYYEIWEAGATEAIYDNYDEPITLEGGKTSFSKPLAKNKEYNIIFWAQASDASIYNVENLKAISVDYANANSNQEAYDAFYYGETGFVAGNDAKTITLVRPFAQLNIGTTKDLLDKAKLLHGDLASASVKVSELATTFNALSGKASGSQKDAEFKTSAWDENEIFSINETNYINLAMNYLLVNDKDNVTVEASFSNSNGVVTTINVQNVPIQRNYRTNIYGNFFTDDQTFNVEINAGFEEETKDIYYELYHAAANGGEVTLSQNVNIPNSLVVKEGVTMTINLGEFDIVNTSNSEELGEGDGIIVYGNLTINGEGTVQGKTRAIWARGDTNAKITINGGTYIGADNTNTSTIYASGNGEINIYGGTFEALTADKTSYADKENGVYAALNIQDNKGTINVYGGSFKNFNPAAPGTEPTAWNEDHPNGFVAEGHVSLNSAADTYTIKALSETGTIETDNGYEAASALLQGLNVKLTGNIETNGSALQFGAGSTSFDANGYSIITGSASNYGFIARGNEERTIKAADVTSQGGGVGAADGGKVTYESGKLYVSSTSTSGRYLFYAEGEGSSITIKDGEFSWDSSKNNKRAYIYAGAGTTVNVKGGTFGKASTRSGYTAGILGDGTVIITGGTFGFDPSQWVANGYEAVKNGENWIVSAKQ